MRIVTTFCEKNAVDILRECLGAEVSCAEGADEEFLANAEILVFLHWRRARGLIPRMKNLRILQALTAGVDHIPPEEVPEGVILSSNSGANAWAVAEHAFSLILTALKRIPQRDRRMRLGEFPQMEESRLLRGKKVGIVGFGNIGQNIARMLAPFDVGIYAINSRGVYSGDLRVKFVGKLSDLPRVAGEVDILVISIPLTPETKGIINRGILERMKKNAILVNVARGKIIVERDLYEFLRVNPEFTACLDVWWHYRGGFKQDYPFEELDNVIMTPHCGGVYEGWERDSVLHACGKIKKLMKELGWG